MLSLKVNGEAVELPDDFAITFNLKSPIFNEVGSFSYPFKLPRTPRTQQILKFRDRIESTFDPYQDFPGQFFWNGVAGPAGCLRCKVADSKHYEGTMYEREGDFYYQLKNKNLQQIDLGSRTFADENEAIAWINSAAYGYHPDFPCAFPTIYNALYFDPVTEDPDLMMFNMYLNDGLMYLLSRESNRTLIVPMLYMKYLMGKIFTGLGHSFEDQLFSHEDYKRLVLFNSLSCNDLLKTYSYTVGNIIFNMHVPFIGLDEFLKGIENSWAARFFVNSKTGHARLIPLREVIEDETYIEWSNNILSKSTELEEQIKGYHLKMELDSDDTEFDEITDAEDKLIEYFKGSVDTPGDLPPFPLAEIFELRYVVSLKEIWQLKSDKQWYSAPWVDTLLSTQFIFKDLTEKIDMKFSTLVDKAWVICQNKFASWREITPRTFFVEQWESPHRMVGRNYSDNFHLFFDGGSSQSSNDPFYTYWKSFLEWRIGTRLVKVQKQMDFSELNDIDFSKKYRIHGINYLIKSIRVTVNGNRLKPATIELYKI